MKRSMILLSFLVLLFNACSFRDEALFFVFLNPNPEKAKLSEEESRPIMEGHLANIHRLAQEGIIKVAGPFENGGGIFIMQAGSVKDAFNILNSDPGIQAGVWTLDIHPFKTVYGELCAAPDTSEIHAMHLARVALKDDVDASFKSVFTSREHLGYLEENKYENLLYAGYFTDEPTGIIVLNTDNTVVAERFFITNPISIQKKVNHGVKKWWSTPNTFCR